VENRKTLLLQHATVAYNSARDGGGLGNRSHIILQNSIVAENVGGDCSLSKNPFSDGYNIDSDSSCALNHESDIVGVTAGLRSLQNYGGMTRSHALFPGSPARDSGLFLGSIEKDQRGVMRPVGLGVDRGAVEFDGFLVVPTLSPLIMN